jgi:hypothetical protein
MKKNFLRLNEHNKLIFDEQFIKENINFNYQYIDGKIKIKDNEYIDFIPFIPLKEESKEINYNDKIYFHLILYCLWWVSNDDDGINEYYKGCNEILEIFKIYDDIKPINLEYENNNENSFENIVFKISKKDFIIYKQELSRHFCNDISTYPDCGETTARNLINLICFDSQNNNFNIELLTKFNPLKELIEYYEVFNTFKLQSSLDIKDIFGKKLNARDAWSYLLINYINNKNSENINYIHTKKNHYELNSGLAKDGKTSNLLKLITKLLEIEKWEDITNKNILEIEDNTKNGIGKINIKSIYGEFILNLIVGHYYMEDNNKKDITDNDYNFTFEDKEKNKYINYLLKKNININLKIDNYLYYDIDSDILPDYINNIKNVDYYELKEKLFQLSLIDKYDNDLRRRIEIDTTQKYFNLYKKYLINNKKCNEYIYISNDFKFIEELPKLTHLNSIIKDRKITTINLSPLENITSIGNGFLSRCKNLHEINLSPLENITSIGNGFLSHCENLHEINLSPLKNITSISNNFLADCDKLHKINLSPLKNITSIGDEFLSDCKNLHEINLPPLKNITSIGNYFLYFCGNIKLIDFSELINITSIGSDFMYNCSSLKTINLISPNLERIGNNFMIYCSSLKNITLNLPKLSSIGNNFMDDCYSLENITLNLLKLTSIGSNFMSTCYNLKTIELNLQELIKIENDFMKECYNLKTITLDLPKLTSIGDYFMKNCTSLETINLFSPNLETIGDNFMINCDKLTTKNIVKKE